MKIVLITGKGANQDSQSIKVYDLLVCALLVLCTWVQTTEPTFNFVAQEKKLSGVAKISFLEKCYREATAKREAAATERKLVGAAKISNMKK